MPVGNSEGQWLNIFPIDLPIEAGDQCASADGVDGFTRDVACLDGHAEIEPEF